MTGVFLLNDLVRQGRIRRGMVVSGEYITELGRNAAQEVRDVFSDQLASLTLGDAGAAAIVERAPEGAPGIELAGFTTLSEYSRLCVAFPATIGPGTTMHTQAREIHVAGIEESIPRLHEALAAAGLAIDDIDYLIPHQTSARAIEKGIGGVRGPARRRTEACGDHGRRVRQHRVDHALRGAVEVPQRGTLPSRRTASCCCPSPPASRSGS